LTPDGDSKQQQQQTMTITVIGAATANFDTRAQILFPSVNLRRNDGYLFFIQTVPDTTVTTQQYINLIAVLDYGGFTFEQPLEAKFFPKGRPMCFGVAVPRLDDFDDADCTILALPQEFYPGQGSIRSLPVQLSWEDGRRYDVSGMELG
jgi:hypothetical protein